MRPLQQGAEETQVSSRPCPAVDLLPLAAWSRVWSPVLIGASIPISPLMMLVGSEGLGRLAAQLSTGAAQSFRPLQFL